MGKRPWAPTAVVLLFATLGWVSCPSSSPGPDELPFVPDVAADVARDAGADLDAGDLPEVPGPDGGDVPVDVPVDLVSDARSVSCVGADRWFPTFDRTCVQAADCVLVLHQADCCGTTLALGIGAGQQAAFDAAEAQCRAQYPLCDCAPAPTVADDGLTATDPASLGVACRAGRCTSIVTDACEQAARFEGLDGCAGDDGCVVAFHQVNCCGTRVAWGIATAQQPAFGLAEAACRDLYPACGCPMSATQAQDGNTAWQEDAFAASCTAGHCRSRVKGASAGDATPDPAPDVPAAGEVSEADDTVPACGGLAFGACADPALSCQCCPAGGPAQRCLCSTACKTADDCTDPSRPACQQGPGGGGFCAPADFSCCWACV